MRTGFQKLTGPKYVDSHLTADENVVYTARLHWVVYMPAIVAALVGVVWALLLGLEALPVGLALVVVVAPLLALAAWMVVKTSEFAVTNKQLMVKVGAVRPRILKMSLEKVEDISVHQGIAGSVLGYGTVTIKGTGRTPAVFKRVRAPFVFRKHVQVQYWRSSFVPTTAPDSAASTPEAPPSNRDGRRAWVVSRSWSGEDRRTSEGRRLSDHMHEDFEAGLDALRRFVTNNAHALVPSKYRDGDFALGAWVAKQRSSYRRGQLDDNEVAALEAIPGWVWSKRQIKKRRKRGRKRR